MEEKLDVEIDTGCVACIGEMNTTVGSRLYL